MCILKCLHLRDGINYQFKICILEMKMMITKNQKQKIGTLPFFLYILALLII